MNPAEVRTLQPEDLGIGRLFWVIRDAVIVGDAATGRIVLWNPAAEAMFGYTASEVIGRPIELLVPAQLRDAHLGGLERYDQTGHGRLIDQGTPVELPALHKSGEQRWIELSLNPVDGPNASGHFVLAIIRDATARRQAEAAQRERVRAESLAAERSAILDQIAEGVIITDTEGRITFVNTAAHRIHGTAQLNVPVEAWVTAYQLRTLDGQPYPTDELPLARAVHRGETVLDARWLIARLDGTQIVAEGSAGPVIAADGTRLGSVLVVRDVTAHAALERDKDDFLAAISHDLKSPLAAVLGSAQLLRVEAKEIGGVPPERLQARVASIERASRRMNGLLNQIVDLAHLSLDRPLEFRRRPTDLVALARRAVEEQQSTQAEHTLSLVTSDSELIGNWDAARLERVAGNLVENAVKYSPAGGAIVVRICSEQDGKRATAVLEVTDVGLGIAAEDLPRLFDRFWRGPNVRGTIPGTGIGLFTVGQIIKQMGGTIEIESVVGAGSTFRVHLPVDTDPLTDDRASGQD
ncbi:MAG: PAS domain S-box protein [Chloroflexi bacterium]|nr:PAS domain S-box protein [Chloroflexota bacterium]